MSIYKVGQQNVKILNWSMSKKGSKTPRGGPKSYQICLIWYLPLWPTIGQRLKK